VFLRPHRNIDGFRRIVLVTDSLNLADQVTCGQRSRLAGYLLLFVAYKTLFFGYRYRIYSSFVHFGELRLFSVGGNGNGRQAWIGKHELETLEQGAIGR
jgi:hypothetical protein